ncbi:serine/threonine protein kinase [Ramlibacter henchirensis]|uniref:non-specific serine/threonine protein kinase n=1 Tax=Ramlibacter henchirensis TaxID=204072 RepID=A0A4Z0BMN4_9BURK|nr:serine/threonine-protein kinase [Ramlibacter henchirensis]TFZ00553.1 serine/threonine protein kinase [Ramlibacter henchirensis]
MQIKKLGRYDLVRVLGKGAMGVVYEGRDPNLDRHVAIKTIMVDGLGTAAAAEYEERFRIEARSAARLQHPNIVTVYDSDRDGNTAFLVMEFVAGDDLKQLLDRGGRYAVNDALRLIHDLLAALDFAHRQGVVHRDIKPANLLVESGGRLKLTDFGVARIAGESTRTQGSMIGTLKYMAPEQVQGQKVDARADLFSAAVVTYQLLTGSRPFDGDNDFSIIHQVLGHTPAAPTSIAPELPAAVDAVMARALAKNRDERFPTAAEFWQALREAFPELDLPVMAPPQQGTRVPTMPPMAPPLVSARAPTLPGGQITQELELEYWRAVRDSTDARELEGFLLRFPEGIYADLARRRLQRLAAPGDPDLTVLHGMTRAGPAPAAAGNEATATATATVPLQYGSDASEADRAWQALAQAHATLPTNPDAGYEARARLARVAALPKPAPMPRTRPSLRWAGAATAVVSVALLAVLLWTRSPGADAGAATAASPETPPSAAPTAIAAPAPAATAPAAPAAGSTIVGTARAPATPALAPASAVRTVSAAAVRPASSPVPAVAATPATTATARRAGTAPTSAPAPTSAAAPAPATPAEEQHARADEPRVAQSGGPRAQHLVPPSETCKDKIFVLKEFCLQNECAKPGYQNFPACVRLKEEARLRDESRVRN